MEFKEIELSDKEWVDEILAKKDYYSCEYCFGNHFIWKNTYNIKIAKSHEFYVVALENDENEKGISFLYPAGVGNVKPVIDELLLYCEKLCIPFVMHSASEDDIAELERLFPGKFIFNDDRNFADYIYTVESLTNLSGKKLHGKRNHIARFKDNNWSFEEINADNIGECLDMNKVWCQENNCGKDKSLIEECCAVRRSFKYFKELNLFGGLLRVDGRVVAYTIGEKMNDKVVVVHFEKAFSEVQGAYPTINREFVANMCQGFEFVNREEDMGLEGLRKAKLSYNPAILFSKYGVKLK